MVYKKGYKMPEWIWETKDNWTDFDYDADSLASYQTKFSFDAANTLSAIVKIPRPDQAKASENFEVILTGLEAYYSSEIEGIIHDKDTLKESVRYQFARINQGSTASEKTGIANMMAHLFDKYDDPLSEDMMNQWNYSLIRGAKDLQNIGKYREHPEPMQVISGPFGRQKVDFEAPPSADVPRLMEDFIEWFNDTAPNGKNPLPSLIRAGLAHLHFVTIHPYEDGNGRISRALCEKALSQSLDKPTLISLSHAISNTKSEYYDALQHAQITGDAQPWLEYFCKTAITAQKLTREKLQSYIMLSEIESDELTAHNNRIKKFITKLTDFSHDKDKELGFITVDKYMRMSGSKESPCTEEMAIKELDILTAMGYIQKRENTKKDQWVFEPENSYDKACSSHVKRVGRKRKRALDHAA
jgi:Fic family protein